MLLLFPGFAAYAGPTTIPTRPDPTGEWESMPDQLVLEIHRDPDDKLVVTATLQGTDLRPSATIEEPSGCLRFSVRFATSVYYHCLELEDPDTLLDDVRIEGEARDSAQFVLHRSTPELREKRLQAALAVETPANVDGFRAAELAYFAAFDEWVSLTTWPRGVASLNATAIPFGEGSAPYQKIGWRPEEFVVGSYSVEVSADGKDFTVDGWQDLDRDGVPAHWQATRDTNAHRVTPEGVR